MFEERINDLTVEEKAAIVSGTDFMYTNPIPRLGIPSIRMSDGPHGLRVQNGGGDNGIAASEPATAFPTAACTASGWNPENTHKIGEAIAEECLHYGVDILLGPGANIKRNPLCGRNFEYFSEDPVLAGTLAAAEVEGVQSKGVGVSVKHFALNNSENYRFMGNSICDMRAMREIYLKVFEIIVKKAKPHTMMCAYNQINGSFCSENQWLLTEVLRGEWGFDGAVITDWGAIRDRVAGLKAGLDLEMPGDTAVCRRWILESVKDGSLPMAVLDEAVKNILRLVDRYKDNPKGTAVDFAAHNALAARIAEDCAVLLKNDGTLPLAKNKKYFVAGDLFAKMRYQGAGSSMINPTFVTSPQKAFEGMGIAYDLARGYKENEVAPDNALINEAVQKAQGYDTVLVFAGLTDYVESEGGDRENMRLPENQLALLSALKKTGKKIVVVLYGGSPVELPFADEVSAILNMYLPGQNGGTATARLLFGDASPSGRLAETWPLSYGDVPFGESFGKGINEVYSESVQVGYRYYLSAKKAVRYPFGHGLSYTTFEYRNMQVSDKGSEIKVTCEITNTGTCDGAEVVQLYVRGELRGFAKVYLKSGESRPVEITVSKDDLRHWNIKEDRWVLENGEYEFTLCSDCQTVKLREAVHIEGEKDVEDVQAQPLKIPALPPKSPMTLESRFTDLKQSFMGKILYNAVTGVAKKDMKAALKLPEGTERDNKIKGAQFLMRIFDSNSLRSMSMSAGASFPYNFAEGFMHLTNGHFLKGIRAFCVPIKAPKLPKDQ